MRYLMNMALTVVFFAGATRPAWGQVEYTATDLGTLGGPDVQALGINSSGQVIGNADGAVSGTGFAFLWTAPGPMVSLGALGSLPTQSNATGINDSSWVVGQSNNEGFVYTPTTGMQGVGLLPGGSFSELYSINNSDTAVGGAATVGSSGSHAIVWDAANGMRDLNATIVNPPANWTPTVANLINNGGVMAGIGLENTSTTPPSGAEHAFILNGGTLTEIPNPGTEIFPEGINSADEVVGYYTGTNGQAFEYTPLGGTRGLGGLDGLQYSEAFGVNDFGTIVGGAYLPNGSYAAFIYTDPGGMVNLNSLVSIPGWTLVSANAINDSGQIAATGVNAENVGHGFLLTPTPEPSTVGLGFSAAVTALILRIWFRRRWMHPRTHAEKTHTFAIVESMNKQGPSEAPKGGTSRAHKRRL